MLAAIRNWVVRTMMKAKGETGIVKTLPKKEIVEINTQITAQRLMENGVDPRSLKNADQVENAIIAIESRPKVQQGIRSTKSADVFDLEGKKINTDKGIMGGKQIPDDDLPPPGSRGGPDDIAAPVQSSEETMKNMIESELMKSENPFSDLVKTTKKGPKTIKEREAEILASMEKSNKETVQRIKNRKMVKDAIDNVSPGFVKGDRKYNAQLVAEELAETKFGKEFYDLDQRQQMDLYDEALDGLSVDPNKFAEGGRIGYKLGSFKTILNFLNENNPVQAYKKYLQSVKTRAQENPKALVPELAAVASGGIFVNRRMQDILKNMKEKDMENNLENFREELNKDPFYQKYPDIKDKVLENYTEKMFGEKRADGGRIGYFMGSANPKGLGTLRAILNYMSKKGKETGGFKGADLSGLDMLRLSNPKALNKMLEDVRGKVNIREGIMGTDTVRAQQQALREQRKGLTEKSLDVAKAMKEDQDKIKIRLAKETETTIIPRVKKQLMEGMGMSEEVAEKAARDMAEAAQNIKLMDSPPEITDEGLLQLENVLKNMETGGKKKRDLNADGGRIGFKDGMTRRTFLKILGGAMSIPIIGKVLAPLKLAKGVKKVPIIKTDNVPGKPEWFDALVNKVIIEGDDVTKTFATGERQSIHQKRLDDGSVVRVTEDIDDGAVRVEYESETNVFGDTATMQYKKPLPDEGDPRPTAEFTTAESGPVGRSYGPDDYEIEVDEVGGTSIRDLDSDVSKLKEYATGKKLTMKEIVESKKRRDKAKAITEDPAAQSDAVIRRQGDADDSYYGDPDEFASGGIARMLGE